MNERLGIHRHFRLHQHAWRSWNRAVPKARSDSPLPSIGRRKCGTTSASSSVVCTRPRREITQFSTQDRDVLDGLGVDAAEGVGVVGIAIIVVPDLVEAAASRVPAAGRESMPADATACTYLGADWSPGAVAASNSVSIDEHPSRCLPWS